MGRDIVIGFVSPAQYKFLKGGSILILGDSLIELKRLPDNFVDAVVTDPPYELGFMGKSWDNTGIAYKVELWKEVLRVLKPGGHLLSFGGSRTYHRMACAIEDAGFEIRDQIMWVYGSGFPKSLNIGKAVDKLQGNERELVGKGSCGYQVSISKSRLEQGYRPNLTNATTEVDITKGNSVWEGWGTALKPAHEPIVLARKPLSEKTVAENVLKWGVGGINIDGCRVGLSKDDNTIRKAYPIKGWCVSGAKSGLAGSMDDSANQGRFPANFIHDGSQEVLELFPNTKVGARRKGQLQHTKDGDIDFTGNTYTVNNYPANSGSAARFFYCAKASKSERDRGCEEIEAKEWRDEGACIPERDNRPFIKSRNNHPTVKPLALMKYLIKLVSREGQVILDPFMGSGTTGMAAKELNREFIGIEMNPDYMEIAKRRIG